jgi:hypothetical protein
MSAHTEWVRGIPLRVDCGTDDSFLPAAGDYAQSLTPPGMAQVEIERKLGLRKGHVWHVLQTAGLVGEGN